MKRGTSKFESQLRFFESVNILKKEIDDFYLHDLDDDFWRIQMVGEVLRQ